MAIGTTAAIIGGSIISGGLGFAAASKQGKALAKGTTASIAEQRRQFDIAQELTAPRREAENAALNELRNLLGIGTGEAQIPDLEQIPGFQFTRDESLQAVERSAAARGGLASGNTFAALQDRAAGLASQNFLTNFLNPLQNLALGGAGENAAGRAVNLGVNVGNLQVRAGENRASSIGAKFGSLNTAFQGGLSNFLLQQQLGAGGGTPGFNPGFNQPNQGFPTGI